MAEIRIIDAANKRDCIFHNEPFPLWGRLIPSYVDEKWSYTVQKWPEDERSEMCFPDENYDFDEMSANSVFLGAYENGECIGIAVLQKAFFKYMYIADLEVRKEFRRKGIGKQLIRKACEVALAQKYRGLYLQAQDNNLSACLFYLKAGFRIGGMDTDVYKGTSQEGKTDIAFYLDA